MQIPGMGPLSEIRLFSELSQVGIEGRGLRNEWSLRCTLDKSSLSVVPFLWG